MKYSTFFNISLLFLLSVFIMFRQLIIPGYFSCIIQDTFDYTSWSWQFTEALKEGAIYPRWTPLSYWGYGSPCFILIAPLAFYLVSFFSIFSDSLILAMNCTKFLSLFLSATGMFIFVKEFHPPKIALMTAILYVLFPYNIFGLYYSGTFGSMISLMWFAPIFLFLYRYTENEQYNHIIYAGVCYGGLILTHLINAYMFLFVIGSFMLFFSVTKKNPKYLFAIPLTIMIGILTSAAYVIPLLYEKQFINTEIFMKEGFHFANFFIIPKLLNNHPSGSFWPVYYSEYLFYVALYLILITLFSLQILKSRHMKTMGNINKVNIFFIGIALFSIFLLFGISSFIWNFIPFFKYIIYPYRWLHITTFAIVFLSASGLFLLNNTFKTQKRHHYFIVFLFLLFFILDCRYIGSTCIFTEKDLIPIKPINYNTIHMPVWVDYERIDKNDNKDKVVIVSGEGKAKVIQWESADRVIKIMAQQSLTLRIRTFNFPGWQAYMDGIPTEIRTEEFTGAILINIPEGKHRLVIKFEDTPVRYYSKVISLVSLLGIVFMLALCKKK